MGRFLDDTIRRKVIFLTGKGGVGKSTLALAIAHRLKANGRRVVVAGWNPFEEGEHPSLPELGIPWQPLETIACFREYAIKTLKFEKIYDVVFDNQVLRTFLKAAPGISDGVIAGKIWDIAHTGEYDHVVVDLPSSGHALNFFLSPVGIRKLFRVGFVHRHAEEICNFFQSEATRLDFVAIPEELSITETLETKAKLLAEFPIPTGFLLMNWLTPRFTLPPVSELPAAVGPLAEDYADRIAKDDEVLGDLKLVELPLISLYRVPGESTLGRVARLSEELSQA